MFEIAIIYTRGCSVNLLSLFDEYVYWKVFIKLMRIKVMSSGKSLTEHTHSTLVGRTLKRIRTRYEGFQ